MSNEKAATTKAAPKTIQGYVWDAISGIVTINRNQLKGIKADLDVLHNTIRDLGGNDFPELETYIDNKFSRLIGTKYKSFKFTGEGGTVRNVTPSIQSAHDELDKLVRTFDDAVIIDGQVYLPDAKGNYKRPVLTFTVRADKNRGMSKEDVQKQINEEVFKLVTSTKDVVTENDNEVINQ